jgi:hypothetical protein
VLGCSYLIGATVNGINETSAKQAAVLIIVRGREYTKGELRARTPDGVVRWMNFKTIGIPDPPTDANPMFLRSNTLAFWKKALSFFMPDYLVMWVSGHSKGNPTRSIDVNNLIRQRKSKSRVLS